MFKLEFPQAHISFATFVKQKPKWIKSIKWDSRHKYLCLKHHNAAIKLKAMKITSPNVFIRDHSAEDV